MRRNIAFSWALLLLFVGFCVQAQQTIPGKPVIAVAEISKDVRSWLAYDAKHLRLSGDFKAYDLQASAISKGEFLKQLSSGNYLPVKLAVKDGSLSYQLYKMPVKTKIKAETSFKEVVQDYGRRLYDNYKREGQRLPEFNFKDLNGKTYTSANTKGKILVLKCWFIGCVACVQEMPRLNQLVEQYKDRKDMVFVSLASDSKKNLDAFLKKTKFSYAVVPGQDSYMSGKLGVNIYPTHLIIDKKGLIAKVVTDAEDMIRALSKVP